MLTWQLWDALRHPAYGYPLFERFVTLFSAPDYQRQRRKRDNILIPVLCIFYYGVLFLLFRRWTFFLQIVISAPYAPIMAIMVMLRGSGSAMQVSGIIAQELEKRRYEFLCLLPPGELGVNWMLSTAYLYRRHHAPYFKGLDYVTRDSWRRRWGILLVAGGVLLPLGLLVDTAGIVALDIIVGLWLLVNLIYVDTVQTTLLGCLVGMLTPAFVSGLLDARAIALTIYITLQTIVFMLITVVGIVILPAFFAAFDFDEMLASLITLLMLTGLFVGLRDATIWLCWRLLTRRLEYPGVQPHALIFETEAMHRVPLE